MPAANHETYRGFLESKYHGDFDAWREKYSNPFRDLQDGGRVRNWDNERRLGDLYADGQVGEVVFPNTVPPFFPSFILFRPPAPGPTSSSTGRPESGPTIAGWLTGAPSTPTSGPGSARPF